MTRFRGAHEVEAYLGVVLSTVAQGEPLRVAHVEPAW